jgi:CO/xanthine dehydrogenase FAD-binding subunit
MNRFEYASPTSVAQAVALLSNSWEDSEILAGGTDLLARMKDHVSTPRRVVNIKQLPGLHAITSQAGGLRIGALVTLDRIVDASDVQKNYPALAQAVADAASPQIRNMATIGGNLNALVAGTFATAWACCPKRQRGNHWSLKVTIAITPSSAMMARRILSRPLPSRPF